MKNDNIKLPSNKKFGFFFTLIFLFLSLYFYFEDNFLLTFPLLSISLLLLLVTLLKSNLLLPLNKFWMRIGLLMGMIVNPIIMGIIYFSIFTPVGILMKLSGRDELNLNYKKKITYWKKCQRDFKKNDSFKQQF